MVSLRDQIKSVDKEFSEARADASKDGGEAAIEQLRIQFLGRKGKVTKLFEEMRNEPAESRPEAGKLLNTLRGKIEGEIEKLKASSAEGQLEEKLNVPPLDVTLPSGVTSCAGSLHPVTLMRAELLREFRRLGFAVYDGPEIDFDFYNFSALNFPDHHPARDMQDTFFVAGEDKLVLRTHTSNIQIHSMLAARPPLRIVAPGRTFRCDSDQTHTPMFHQIEAFIVDENISMADLKGVIDQFLKAIFGNDCQTRIRPSFFPFVEPGAEVDMRYCDRWLEIGGCGMIHPNVFEAVGYDSEKYTGFAFGFGIDRMAMLKYRLPDLRMLFEGRFEFFQQFPIFTL